MQHTASLSVNRSPWGWVGQRAPMATAVFLAAALGWCVTAWVLVWPAPTPLPRATVAQAPKALDPTLIARALGQSTGEASAQAVLVLSGVVAASQGTQGAAIIAVNGQAAKPVRVGQAVNADWRLAALTPRSAELVSPQGARLTLSLPSPAK